VFEILVEYGFDFLSEEYRRLFDSSRASPFQHPIWLDAVFRLLVPAHGVKPLVLVARRCSDRGLAMVLPLVRRRRRGLRVVEFADLGVTDYASAVCSEATFQALAHNPRAQQELLNLLKPFDLLRINKVPDQALPVERLFAGARRMPLGVSAHAAALHGPFEAWHAETLLPSFAKELRKKRRQLERQGAITLERLLEPAAIVGLMRELQMFRGRRFPGDLLSDETNFEFYAQVAVAGAASGFARAYRLSLDGQSLGGVWGIGHGGKFLTLISGLDYAAYPRQSLGALAFEDVLRDCIGQNDQVFDFTIGDEGYKRSFGAEPSPMWLTSAYGSGLGMVAERIAAQRRQPEPQAPLPFAAKAAAQEGF
jgi:CelD/BcsL family acetyltransferase involved in cellulose biosynthesis